MPAIDPDVACKECQIAAYKETRGAYNFECADCMARYTVDMIERIAGQRAEEVKNKVFERLSRRKK